MATTQNFKSAFSNIPSLTKALVTSLIVLSCAAYIYTYRTQIEANDPEAIVYQKCPVVGILPGLAFYTPWTFLTAAFYESNVFSLAGSSMVLLLCGKYLERAWGSRELLKFVIISAVFSNLVTWLGIILTFYITGDSDYLYNIQINGMAGVFSAFLVAFKHLIPEHRVALLGSLITIRVKNLIGVATAASIVMLVLFQAIVFYNLVNIGWVIGWIYIRFFKYQDGIQGDHSETFAFVTFFPEFLHPVIDLVANTVYSILVRFRLCKRAPRNYAYDPENQTGFLSMSPLPGSARAEAERRRALALKALDMRLSSKPSTSSPASASSAAVSPSVPVALTAPAAAASSRGVTETSSNVLFEAEEMSTISIPKPNEKSAAMSEKVNEPNKEQEDTVKRD